MIENRPAEFGGLQTGLPVVQDFLYGMGTAMSPPFYYLVTQVVLTMLALRRDRWGRVGILGLVIFGLISVVGALGEPILLEIFHPARFDFLKALIYTGMIILLFGTMIFAMLEWSGRRRDL